MDFLLSRFRNSSGYVFLLRSVDTLESNWSGHFGHAETGSGVKKRVDLRRDFFALILT